MIHVFRVARATGELSEFDAMIEAKLTASQLKNLRAHSFQCALGTGALKRALLENRVELNDKQLEQIAIDTLAARKLALSHYAEDRSSISTWTLEPLIVPKRLLALQGDRFEFKTQSRPHEGMTSSCVDTIPLEILLWPEVQTELRLKLSQLNGVRRLRHRYVELGTVIEEFWEPMESGKPDEDSEALYEEVKSLLHDDQVQRFNQILLQRYVAAFPPYAARHLRRMGEKIPIGNKEFSARMSFLQHQYLRRAALSKITPFCRMC